MSDTVLPPPGLGGAPGAPEAPPGPRAASTEDQGLEQQYVYSAPVELTRVLRGARRVCALLAQPWGRSLAVGP